MIAMKIRNIFAYAILSAAVVSLTACDDDDKALGTIDSPSVVESGRSFDTLHFTWDKIANAVQYGWQLTDPQGNVVETGVTVPPEVTISRLQPATTYTLYVWAYSAINGDYDSAPVVTLTATTDALIKLDTPASIQMTNSGSSYVFTWNEVPDAEQYVCLLTWENGESTYKVSTNSLTVSGLDTGSYSLTVTAVTSVPGFMDSDASTPYTFAVTRTVLWTVTGLYESFHLGQTWSAKMSAFSDGTYTIFAWYGVEGYDFSFSLDPEGEYGEFQMQCGTFDDYSWLYSVPTGLDALPSLDIYPYYDYSYMTGDQTAGTVNINSYSYTADRYVNDTFQWGSAYGDNIAGSYVNNLSGWEWIDDYVEINTTIDATITRIDANTVEINGLFDSSYYGNYTLTATVDESAGTITIEPSEYGWYTFAGDNGPTENVVGTIGSDGTITFENFNLWYDFGGGELYYYLYGMKAILVKQ